MSAGRDLATRKLLSVLPDIPEDVSECGDEAAALTQMVILLSYTPDLLTACYAETAITT